MKIGIIGHRGFVGSAFYEVFSEDSTCEVAGIGRDNYSAVKGSRFDLLINANGNSSKRLAEKDPHMDFEMNVTATEGFLLDFSFDHYIHLSTVEVYGSCERKESTLEGAEIRPAALSPYGFSKYLGELVAARYAKSWIILRLAGMVGNNMAKGPAHDILKLGKLFVSSKSEYHFINTREVAKIAKGLAERGKWGQIYNVVGDGSMPLARFAKIAGVELSGEGSAVQKFNVSVDKLKAELPVPSSEKTVLDFVGSLHRH